MDGNKSNKQHTRGRGCRSHESSYTSTVFYTLRDELSEVDSFTAVNEVFCSVIGSLSGVTAVWIVLFDDELDSGSQEVNAYYGTEYPRELETLVDEINRGHIDPILENVLSRNGVVLLPRASDGDQPTGVGSQPDRCANYQSDGATGQRSFPDALGAVIRLSQGATVFGFVAMWYDTDVHASDIDALLLDALSGEVAHRLSAIAMESNRAILGAALEKRRQEYVELFRTAPVGILRSSIWGAVLDVNRKMLDILGYSEISELHRNVHNLRDGLYVYPEERDRLIGRLLSEGAVYNYRIVARRADGNDRVLVLDSSLIRDVEGVEPVILSFIRDITEEHEWASRAANELRQREALLREIHHRVKNNLSIVLSLLSLESSNIEDLTGALRAFEDSSARIRSIALIHELLYESVDIEEVPLNAVIERLVGSLRYTLPNGCRARIATDLTPMTINLDSAVPIVLTVQELLANAFEFGVGYEPGDEGEARVVPSLVLDVRLYKNEFSEVIVEIEDERFGIDPDRRNGFGLMLVEALVSQVSGEITMRTGPGERGLACVVRFPSAVCSPSRLVHAS